MTGRVCTECGTQIPADAPEGLCTKCLLLAGLKQAAEPMEATAVDLQSLLVKPASPLVINTQW